MNEMLVLIIIIAFVPINYCKTVSKNVGYEYGYSDDWNVTFNLFTRLNRKDQYVLGINSNDSLIKNSGINGSLPTKLIVHGWQSGLYVSNLFNRLWMIVWNSNYIIAIDNIINIDNIDNRQSARLE